MAEFQEVVKQWGRLCKTQKCGDCTDCILTKAGICDSYAKDNAVNAAAIERIVMDWASEHPEPIYPTWIEWLCDVGAIGKDYWSVQDLDVQIPAYIADQLGIKPKEVKRDADGKTSLP